MKGVEVLGCELKVATLWGGAPIYIWYALQRALKIIESSIGSPHVQVCDTRAQRGAVGTGWAGVREEGRNLAGRRAHMCI